MLVCAIALLIKARFFSKMNTMNLQLVVTNRSSSREVALDVDFIYTKHRLGELLRPLLTSTRG